MQRITEAPLTKCPNCGGELTKLLSLSSFHLKGSGWYATDYRGKAPANGNGKAKPDDKKDDKEKEKKPAATTDASATSDGKPTAAK